MERKNKLVAAAIPVIALLAGLVAYQYGYLFVKGEMTSLKETRAIKTKALVKSMELIALKPELERKLEALKEGRKADASSIIEAQTLSLAAAALQETVKGIITGSGGSVTSERVEKPEDLGVFKIVIVNIDAVVPDARAMSDILFGIETHIPYLVVREVDARVRNFRNPRELTVKLKVSALTGGK